MTCETDRARFLGRGRSVRAIRPRSTVDGPLSRDDRRGARPDLRAPRARAAGAAAARRRSRSPRWWPPRASGPSSWPTATTIRYAAQRALDLAWTSAQVELRELRHHAEDAGVFQELAGHLFYANPALRAPQPRSWRRNRGSQPLLWAHGISGDWPILLATIDSEDGLPTLRQLLAAHHYWRRRGMTVDLVVLNTQPSSYFQELEQRIIAAIHGVARRRDSVDRPGGVFARRRDLLAPRGAGDAARHRAGPPRAATAAPLGRLTQGGGAGGGSAAAGARACSDAALGRGRAEHPDPDRVRAVRSATSLLDTAASVVLGGDAGDIPLPTSGTTATLPGATAPTRRDVRQRLSGASTADGDYEIRDRRRRGCRRRPGSNVIANPQGGFLVTERGAGCHLGRQQLLLPAHAVAQRPGQRPGRARCSTCATRRAASVVVPDTRAASADGAVHRCGTAPAPPPSSTSTTASTRRSALGLPEDAAVKLSLLRLTNTRHDARAASRVTAYVEWTLGVLARAHPAPGADRGSSAEPRRDPRAQPVRPAVRRTRSPSAR